MLKISHKNFRLFILLLFLLGIVLPIISQAADKRYVSDILIVTVREKPDNDSKIIKTLKTDTPLEVLKEKDRYLKIRTMDGEEGWVRSQYISTKTPKATIIELNKREIGSLKRKLDKLSQEKDQTAIKLRDLSSQHSSTLQELELAKKKGFETMSNTQGQLQQMTERYNSLVNQSKHVVELRDENETLLAANNKMNKELEYLKQENTHLKRTGMLQWFLAGGGVFLTGLIAGRLGGQRKKKLY